MIATNLVYNKVLPVLSKSYMHTYLTISDLHSLEKEPKNRFGMQNKTLQILDEYIELIKLNKFTGVIFLGDIFDRGFTKCGFTYSSKIIKKIKIISELVKGNCFCVYGNHEDTYHIDNIFFSIASIDCNVIAERIKDFNKPESLMDLVHTPSVIDFGDVKIYLMHHDKKKRYKVLEKNKQTVVCLHDDFISFESEKELYHHKLGNGINIIKSDIFDNVDWAISGHVHMPVETFELPNERHTVYDNPGSSIQRTIAEVHDKIKIPIICIDSDGLHREYLWFNIGKIDETTNKEMVKDQRQKKEMSKVMKKQKEVKNWGDYNEFISLIKSDDVKGIIQNSDRPIIPKSVELYNNRYKTGGK